jgi:uncharacterized DUF497 family protein
VRFTWDPDKASSNLKKHGVSFPEAATVFADPLALVMEDLLHDERAILVGLSKARRVLFTVFAEVSEDTIRIISARRATSHERRRYEEGEP